MRSSKQILLPLESRRPDRFEDFVSGPNEAVVRALEELLVTTARGQVFISGPEGSGKSHLLNAACNRAQERGKQAIYFALGRLPDAASAGLAGLEYMDLICFDDIDQVAGNGTWEHALFHCFNRVRDSGGRLVISSSTALSRLVFGLPDLASRLSWDIRLRLEPLNDAAKSEVLFRRCEMLGIELPAEVGHYLLSRGGRSISMLLANLDAIRVAALTGKRKITVPLAREVLSA